MSVKMNRKHKGLFVGILLLAITLVAFGSTFFIFKKQKQNKDEKMLTIVTSFYPMYVAAANVVDGVETVHLENLSEPETGCLHDYQLSPEDMKLLATADVFIVNGGGMEDFLTDVATAYPDLLVIRTSDGIAGSSENAHVWMSVSKHKKQVQAIADALSSVDAAHAKEYQKNTSEYLQELTVLQNKIEDLKKATQGQPVVLFHEALAYFTDDLGFEVVYTMDLDEERQVSAGEVAAVMSVVKEYHVSAILADETYGKETADMVADGTMARAIYLDPMVKGAYDKDSYIMHMQENIQAIRDNFVAR